jgi:hypothetical protein
MEWNNEFGRKFYDFNGFYEISNAPAVYPHEDAIIWIKFF